MKIVTKFVGIIISHFNLLYIYIHIYFFFLIFFYLIFIFSLLLNIDNTKLGIDQIRIVDLYNWILKIFGRWISNFFFFDVSIKLKIFNFSVSELYVYFYYKYIF